MFHHRDHGGDKGSWTLVPKRPVLVLGDSNVGRLPLVLDKRVQVELPGGSLGACPGHREEQDTDNK